MKVFTLTRICENEFGTFGVLVEGKLILTTVERPWDNNKADISCVPEGESLWKRLISPKFGETFGATDIPNRSNILMHKGNYCIDSKGCIIVGTGFDEISNMLAVTNSGAAFSKFIKHMMGENEFKLVIKRA